MNKWIVVAGICACLLADAAVARAQDKGNALLDLLIKKGIITKDEADQVRTEWEKQLAAQLEKYDKTKVPKWIKEVEWAGDIRLRHKSFWWEDARPDRHRERIRVRFGFTSKFADDKTTFGLRLATGTLSDQVSANQTLTDVFSRKTIGFDQIYIRHDATGWLSLWGGKFPYPWYLAPVESRMIWDDDVNPEGLAERLHWKPGKDTTVFVNAAQLPLKEFSEGPGDAWLFFEQIGVETKLTDKLSAKLAGHFYHTSNAEEVPLTDSPNRGNTLVGGRLLGDYEVLGVAGELTYKTERDFIKTVSLVGEFDENIASRFDEDTTGWTVGLRLNSAKKKGEWDLAYFYKYIEADAVWAALSDSDWGTGGTDRKGHVVALTYMLQDWWQLRGKLFVNEKISSRPFAGAGSNAVPVEDLVRLQLDSMWRF
jgi:polyhydroxyalkanoate synthesis regulator phasin